MSDATFNVGDEACWTSRARGSVRERCGRVVVVVPARMTASDALRLAKLASGEDGPLEGTFLDRPGGARDHCSYLIQVNASKKLFWPRVADLSQATRGRRVILRCCAA